MIDHFWKKNMQEVTPEVLRWSLRNKVSVEDSLTMARLFRASVRSDCRMEYIGRLDRFVVVPEDVQPKDSYEAQMQHCFVNALNVGSIAREQADLIREIERDREDRRKLCARNSHVKERELSELRDISTPHWTLNEVTYQHELYELATAEALPKESAKEAMRALLDERKKYRELFRGEEAERKRYEEMWKHANARCQDLEAQIRELSRGRKPRKAGKL